MKSSFKNGEEYYNKIYLQFNAFIAISLVPFGYLLLLRQSGDLYPVVDESLRTPLVVVLLLAVAGLIFQAIRSFDAQSALAKEAESLRAKLVTYQSLSIRKYISFLLAELLCVCGLYLSANAFFIVAYIVAIILLSIKRPTLNVIIEDLALDNDEQKILIDKLTIE